MSVQFLVELQALTTIVSSFASFLSAFLPAMAAFRSVLTIRKGQTLGKRGVLGRVAGIMTARCYVINARTGRMRGRKVKESKSCYFQEESEHKCLVLM